MVAARATRAAPDDTGERVTHSRLLPEILTGLDDDPEGGADDGPVARHITVLDLGPGAAGTVEFFSRFPSRLYFCDVLNCSEILNSTEELDYLAMVRLWRTYLGLRPDTRIDILLLWDYLHYLNLQAVEALSSVLQPAITASTRGYGFGSLHNDQTIPARRYAIADKNHLTVQPIQRAQARNAHSQQRITENFMCMRISRGTLLQDGYLELLFEP